MMRYMLVQRMLAWLIVKTNLTCGSCFFRAVLLFLYVGTVELNAVAIERLPPEACASCVSMGLRDKNGRE